ITLIETLEKQGYFHAIDPEENTSEQVALEDGTHVMIKVGLRNVRDVLLTLKGEDYTGYRLFIGDNGEVCGTKALFSPAQSKTLVCEWVMDKPVADADIEKLLGSEARSFQEESSLVYTFDEFTVRVVSESDNDVEFFKLDEDDILPKVVRAIVLCGIGA